VEWRTYLLVPVWIAARFAAGRLARWLAIVLQQTEKVFAGLGVNRLEAAGRPWGAIWCWPTGVVGVAPAFLANNQLTLAR
jgi:hypothetical protein